MKKYTNVFITVAVIVATVILVLFGMPFLFKNTYFYVMHPLRVNDNSMEPTVREGSLWIVQPRTNRTVKLEPGTLVLAVLPMNNNQTKLTVLRTIAPQAQVVSQKNGALIVGGKKAKEEYLRPSTVTPKFKELFVPFASYFLLGDNREEAYDSTEVGGVKQEDIVSVLRWCYWKCN